VPPGGVTRPRPGTNLERAAAEGSPELRPPEGNPRRYADGTQGMAQSNAPGLGVEPAGASSSKVTRVSPGSPIPRARRHDPADGADSRNRDGGPEARAALRPGAPLARAPRSTPGTAQRPGHGRPDHRIPPRPSGTGCRTSTAEARSGSGAASRPRG